LRERHAKKPPEDFKSGNQEHEEHEDAVDGLLGFSTVGL
jgi:hypothetical protein